MQGKVFFYIFFLQWGGKGDSGGRGDNEKNRLGHEKVGLSYFYPLALNLKTKLKFKFTLFPNGRGRLCHMKSGWIFTFVNWREVSSRIANDSYFFLFSTERPEANFGWFWFRLRGLHCPPVSGCK